MLPRRSNRFPPKNRVQGYSYGHHNYRHGSDTAQEWMRANQHKQLQSQLARRRLDTAFQHHVSRHHDVMADYRKWLLTKKGEPPVLSVAKKPIVVELHQYDEDYYDRGDDIEIVDDDISPQEELSDPVVEPQTRWTIVEYIDSGAGGTSSAETLIPRKQIELDAIANTVSVQSIAQLPIGAPNPQSLRRYMNAPIDWLRSCFLPKGYPHGVHKDYSNFYFWMAMQSAVGSCTYIMSMDAMLQSVNTTASLGIAVGMSWVLKDGIGAIGTIGAAKVLGDKFDADATKYKIFSDVLHNFGVAFELMTVYFPALFYPLGALANTLKGIAGLANGACKATINKHMALANNMGDVTAKGHAQGIGGHLTGVLGAATISLYLPTFSTWLQQLASDPTLPYSLNTVLPTLVSGPSLMWFTFFSLAGLHMYCSYKAVRAVALDSVTAERGLILMDEYFQFGKIPTPDGFCSKKMEPITFAWARPFSNDYKILLGESLQEVKNIRAPILLNRLKLFEGLNYLVEIVASSKKILVFLRDKATEKDIFKSLFQAGRIRFLLRTRPVVSDAQVEELIQETTLYAKEHCDTFLGMLMWQGWKTDEFPLHPKQVRFSVQ